MLTVFLFKEISYGEIRSPRPFVHICTRRIDYDPTVQSISKYLYIQRNL